VQASAVAAVAARPLLLLLLLLQARVRHQGLLQLH
jgi:hypothetical protein